MRSFIQTSAMPSASLVFSKRVLKHKKETSLRERFACFQETSLRERFACFQETSLRERFACFDIDLFINFHKTTTIV
ncbi:hypothetical protein [Campylobacter majalis]|uniref:hypothetical protein n=1 Tax=Campylobacter majalis TaxID=2790656 RepID=UPI003D684D86